jgi:hypothetical protein
MNVVVIGAGIFGTSISIKLRERDFNVTLIDSNPDIMMEASRLNHNRLHYGFHYPRSFDTARQSLDGYESFYRTFKNSISNDFPNYYLVENDSNVNSLQYKSFCDKLELEYTIETPNIDMDLSRIESSYRTKEPIYDFDGVKNTLKEMLLDSGVNVIFNNKVSDKDIYEKYDVIINTTYSSINEINNILGIPQTKLRLQKVVIPIFKMNMEKIGITIMDGEFCSILPKGFDPNTFLLYHVKYSVIKSLDSYTVPSEWKNENLDMEKIVSKIYKESEKYFRFLKDAEPIGYWQSIRALPINDDDSRVSNINLYELDEKKIITLISGKITTCLDIGDLIKNML